MASLVLCRLCRANATVNNCLSIASKRSREQNWPNRIEQLLKVKVAVDDGLPNHCCMKCCRRVEGLEKAARDLELFRELASKSYSEFQSASSHKRSKETSAVQVTPDTARARPPAKKHLSSTSRALTFGGMSTATLVQPSITIDVVNQNSELLQETCAEIESDAEQYLTYDLLTGHSDSGTLCSERLPLRDCSNAASEQHIGNGQGQRCETVTVSSVAIPASSGLWSRLNDEESEVERALAGGHIPSIAKALIQHSELRESILQLFLCEIEAECATLCRKKSPSLFRKLSANDLMEFEWEKVIVELEERAPLFLRIYSSIVSVNDYRNQHKFGAHHHPGICMATAIILKERNREICGLQSLISLLLFSSHVEKKVYSQLNHVNVCLSYTAVQKLVEEFSKLYTDPIKQWIEQGITFKFIGDNLDKNRRVRDYRSDHQGQMMHMYSILVARTRVPTDLPQTGEVAPIMSLPWTHFLPNKHDLVKVENNLVVLVSRLITTHIKCLQPLAKYVPEHIKHKHSEAMSQKSDVVVLDVLMKNEAYGPDMIDIMRSLQGYLGSDYPPTQRVMSGGDQLTCERQAAAQRHMMHEDSPADQLQLLEPQVEDWHGLVCFMTAAWKCLYNKSSLNHGTLGFFRSKLNRVAVKKKLKDDFNACLDFLLTVVYGHVIATACKELEISSPNASLQIASNIVKGTHGEQYAFVTTISEKVVKKCTLIKEAFFDNVNENEPCDRIYNYARVLCHFGALVMEFLDAWGEGDGERVYRCWRLFLPHFVANHHTKYALQALRFQFQVEAYLSQHLAHHVLWDRFINTKGGMGKNIPCDLHNEHMNKLLKEIVANMGPNLTEVALQRAARSVSTIHTVCQNFEKQSGVPFVSSAHSTRSNAEDIAKVVSTVLDKKLLIIVPGRKHSSFPRLHLNPLHHWKIEDTRKWIENKKKQFSVYKGSGRGEGNESDPEASDDDDDQDSDEN